MEGYDNRVYRAWNETRNTNGINVINGILQLGLIFVKLDFIFG